MRCRHRSTASIVFSSAKYASRDIPETWRAMRSQFSMMSPSRSSRLLEDKDLILFGFGGDAGTQAILADEVYWPADPFLERLLDAAVAADAPHHGRIHLDDDVDIAVRSFLAARDRSEYRSMDHPHAFKLRLMRPQRANDAADHGFFLCLGVDIGSVARKIALQDRFDVVRQRPVVLLCPPPCRCEHRFVKTNRNHPAHSHPPREA